MNSIRANGFLRPTGTLSLLIFFLLALVNCGAVLTQNAATDRETAANINMTVAVEQLIEVEPVSNTARTLTIEVASLQPKLAISGFERNPAQIETVLAEVPHKITLVGTMFEWLASLTAPGSNSVGLASGNGQLWASDASRQRIYAVNPRTGKVSASMITDATSPRGLAWQNGNLWIADQSRRLLYQVSPGRAKALTMSVIPAPGGYSAPCGLAYGGGALWVSHGCARGDNTNTIYRIDSNSGRVLNSFPSPGNQPEGLAYSNGRLWNVDGSTGTIYRLNPSSGTILEEIVVSARTTGPLVGLAHDSTFLWVNDSLNIHQVRP